MIQLNCEKCLVDYEKPAVYKLYNEQYPSVFWRWSLKFCDICRRQRETEALENLPKVLNHLSDLK